MSEVFQAFWRFSVVVTISFVDIADNQDKIDLKPGKED
jgi:hypothetical protein